MAKAKHVPKTKKTADAEEKPARLVILDAHAIMHRAYHAIPDFSSSKGEPTGALYGLTSILLKMVGDLKPDYIVAARDLPGKTHRHEAFEAYKATRAKTDDALIVQLTRAPIVFEAFGIPLYDHAGYEADDVIGTIVKALSPRHDIMTIIASGDMDALQLVDERIKVYTMRKGITDTVLYDVDMVKERYGFPPERVVDYKALRGDPSDNIPGIRGIGEKTATELIKEFGSIEDMYSALAKSPSNFAKKVKPRVLELVKGGEADALFSKQLATIHSGVPVTFELPKRRWHLEDNVESIVRMCEELEFRSLKERVQATVGKTNPEKVSEKKNDGPAVDPRAQKEVSVALWLIRSDLTSPTLDDIYTFANTEDFDRAREHIFTQLRDTGRLSEVYEKIERPLIPIVDRMNARGILLDTTYLKKLAKEYNAGLSEMATRIYRHTGHEFNINSPKQLATVLYDELKITPVRQKKTPTGARTTREEELEKISSLHPIIADVLAYRELQKLLSTYIDKMPGLVDKDKRLHTEFLQAGTTTGRMGSQDPNLQNIPVKTESGRRIRKGFIASPGFSLVALDYSQIELRIAAGLSGDEKLVDIFKRGGDVHEAVAAQVFNVPPEMVDREMRRRAKVINFGILYGMGVNALRANLGADVTREEAAQFLSDYFKNFAGLSRFIEKTKHEASKRGYTETIFGRRRYFPGLKSSLPGLRAQAERMAVNAPMQGTQSDIIKLAMIEADSYVEKNKLRDKVHLLLQVHDELVYEVAKSEVNAVAKKLKDVMESAAPIEQLSGVPIKVEVNVGPNWGDLSKLDIV